MKNKIFACMFILFLLTPTSIAIEIKYDDGSFENGMIVNPDYSVRVRFNSTSTGELIKVKIFWWGDSNDASKFYVIVRDANNFTYFVKTNVVPNTPGEWQDISIPYFNVNGPFYVEVYDDTVGITPSDSTIKAVGMDTDGDSGNSYHKGSYLSPDWTPVSEIGWPCNLGIRAILTEETTTTVPEETTTTIQTTTTVSGGGRGGGGGGGTIFPTRPSCFDGIQNQGEEGVDCGGPCQPCVTTTSTTVETTTTVATTTSIKETTTIEETTTTIEVPLVGKATGTTGTGGITIITLLILIILITILLYRRRRRDEE